MKKSDTRIFDVVQLILEMCGKEDMSVFTVQRLTYYCQAWHLGWEGERIFKEDFQAWASGPVCPELFALRNGLMIKVADVDGDARRVKRRARESCAAVVRDYGGLSAIQLSELVRTEKPWLKARVGLRGDERGEKVITAKAMRKYYGSPKKSWMKIADLEWPEWMQ